MALLQAFISAVALICMAVCAIVLADAAISIDPDHRVEKALFGTLASTLAIFVVFRLVLLFLWEMPWQNL